MLRHYVTVVFRHVLRHKVYSGIIVVGLALALASYLLIAGYVDQEQSYDRIHQNGERIYRVESVFSKNGEITDNWPTSSNGYASAMQSAFPEVEDYTRISWRSSTRVVRYEATKFREEHVCFADANFFTFFNYPVLKGDPKTFLQAPNAVVISESAAHRYFGQTNPIGKLLTISTTRQTLSCQVTGVFADLPTNSTMQFDMLMSWLTSPEKVRDFWYQHETYSFVRLQPNANPRQVEAKFPAMSETYKTAEAMRDLTWGVELVPLHDIHLNPAKPNEIEVKGNRRAVNWLSMMALVILVIGWVNYINLATAQAMDRAREVGVRKAIGSHRSMLLVQFLMESLLLNGVALVLAIVLAGLASYVLPHFLTMTTPLINWGDPARWAIFALLFLIGVLVSGIYPALVLSNVKPVLALKGTYRFSSTGVWLRKGLVILQFGASMVLLVGTFVAYRQLDYMIQRDLGVNIEQVLVLKSPVNTDDYLRKTQSFKDELKKLAGVRAVSGSGSVPGREVGQVLANRRFGSRAGDDKPFEMLTVDYDFIKAFDLNLVAGRNFDRARPADQYGLVLNESAVRQFGFTSAEQAIGQKILLESTTDRPNEIIGVIKDYHQQGLQRSFTPVILFMDPDYQWLPTDFYSIRLSTQNLDGVIREVRQQWTTFFPESSMDYFFLDEFFNQQYQQDLQFGRNFLLFSSLAIFIACLGLFGLTSYSTARRTKEIGVRKVLGASVFSILSLLVWDLLRLVLLAALVAFPISWYLIRQWLATYAFRIELNASHWLIPVLILTVIALATISFLTVKAALANPTKALRSE